MISRGEKSKNGNLNLRILNNSGLKLRVNVGDREWICPRLHIPRKYLREYGHLLDGSRAYQITILRRGGYSQEYEVKITVTIEKELEGKNRVMALYVNSEYVDWAIVNKKNRKLVETGRLNCHEVLDASSNKTKNLLHKLVNKIGNIAEYYDAEVVVGKLNTGRFNSWNSRANRRVKQMPQFKFRQILRYKLPLRGVPVSERSEAYTTQIAQHLRTLLGIDVHKASAYAFAIKILNYEDFQTLRDVLVDEGDGSPDRRLSEGCDLTGLIQSSAELSDRYMESTAKRYRTCVKRYFKWLKNGDLNGDDYPQCVEWMEAGGKKRRLPREILSRGEVERLAGAAERLRDEALVWVGYESGCRPGELLGLKVRDVEFDEYGGQIVVDGKTGERRIRLVESVRHLRDWLSEHPKGSDPDAPIWWNGKGGSLARWSWSRVLKELAGKAGIKKGVHPHLLRHSRGTHLAARGVNEAQLREIFGWTRDSDMPATYVHLSGRDTDAAILNLYGIYSSSGKNGFDSGSKRKKCPRCGRRNPEGANFCNECGEKLNSSGKRTDGRTDAGYRSEEDEVAAKLVGKMMEKFSGVVKEIVQEEKLAADP